MKVSSFLFLAILLAVPLFFQAQPDSYNVFYVRGTAFLVEKNKKDTLRRGMNISPGDKLMIHDKEFVVLLNNKKMPALIDKEGIYSYTQLSAIFQQQAGNSLIYDYFNWLVNEFLARNVEKTQAATVFRGDTIPMTFPPDSTWVYDNKIVLKWKSTTSGRYFIIRNDHDDVLKIYTKDNNLELFPYSSGMKKGMWYRWIVSDNNDPGGNSVYNTFFLPDDKEIKDMKNKELQVLSWFPEQKNEEYYTCLIALYIQYHDYKNAYEQVREAKRHNFESPEMKKLYLAVDKLYGMK